MLYALARPSLRRARSRGVGKGKKAILVLASGGIFSEGALEIMGFHSGLHWN